MRKNTLRLVVGLSGLAASALPAYAAMSWSLLNGNVETALTDQREFNKEKIRISGMYVDSTTNRAYISTNVGLATGNVQVLNATTGAPITTLTNTGGVSQFVKAGDGNIYGVVNERTDKNNETSGRPYRIIKIDSSNNVTEVWRPSMFNAAYIDTTTPIVGIGLNPKNGNPIWTISGSAAFKNTSGFEYNTGSGVTSLRTNGNTGFSSTRTGFGNATAVGLDSAGNPIVGYHGTANNANSDGLHFDPTYNNGGGASIDVGGVVTNNGNIAAPGFVNNAITVSTYDIRTNNYWSGFSGSSSSAILAVKNGADNPNGDTATDGVNANTLATGLQGVRHGAPDIGPGQTYSSGQAFFIDAMVGDGAGNILYAIASDITKTYATTPGAFFGKVARATVDAAGNINGLIDEGSPAVIAGLTPGPFEQVIALSTAQRVQSEGGGLITFAATLDNNGVYRVYKTPGTVVPEPATIGLLALGGAAFLRRRRA